MDIASLREKLVVGTLCGMKRRTLFKAATGSLLLASQSALPAVKRMFPMEGSRRGNLYELLGKDAIADPVRLAAGIKALPVRVTATRPIDEAISTAGGVMFEGLSAQLQLGEAAAVPQPVFCAGEMLDWEAPTGGYLLTACFASGRVAGQGVLSHFGL